MSNCPTGRRVVVTGLGIVSPVGNNLKQTWDNIIAGKSGVISIDKFDTTGFA
ncbi:MAG: beta-ketoacyl-ACP synthase II, partial [Gammaproteobacteria bacterium]|nr:beta-ketoacyl-ACP synthase II [Gammaproteobacteria bacterium]